MKVGLTGGIGSGKSTVANYFAELGVPIIDADQIAHDITKAGKPALQEIANHFGKSILTDDGSLKRARLRRIIFQDKNERHWLENLLHPMIRQIMFEKAQQCHYPYCILVIPLLAEVHDVDFIDRVVVVEAPIDLQIARTTSRDKASAEDIEAIIDSQSSNIERLKIADDIITNDADLVSLKNKVADLHKAFLIIANQNYNNG